MFCLRARLKQAKQKSRAQGPTQTGPKIRNQGTAEQGQYGVKIAKTISKKLYDASRKCDRGCQTKSSGLINQAVVDSVEREFKPV
jgi:membrane protein involved in colicin uptake